MNRFIYRRSGIPTRSDEQYDGDRGERDCEGIPGPRGGSHCLKDAAGLGKHHVREAGTEDGADLRAQRFSLGLLHTAIDQGEVTLALVQSFTVPGCVDGSPEEFAPGGVITTAA